MIDLHVHTAYSDGTFSVGETLKEAQKQNVSVLSITDHNTIEAYNETEYRNNLVQQETSPILSRPLEENEQ